MTEEKKIERDKKEGKKHSLKQGDRKIDRSFNSLEQRLNELFRMLLLPRFSRAAYRKKAKSEIESGYFNTRAEKKTSELRELNRARAEAIDQALKSLAKEFKKKYAKMRETAALIPLIDTIRENLKVLRKQSKNAAAMREGELKERLEALEAGDLMPEGEGDEALSGTAGDADGKGTSARFKAQEECMRSNDLALEAAGKIINAVTGLESTAGLVNLALCYYRRYRSLALMLGITLSLTFFLLFGALIFKKTSPILRKADGEITESQTGEKVSRKPERKPEPKQTASPKQPELSPDELFRDSLLKRKKFIPSCENNYVVVAGKDLFDPAVERGARSFLESQSYPLEGDKAVQIIKVRDEGELVAALKSGAVNSPYCVKGQFFPPKKLGFDLGRFPVYLPKGMDPRGIDAKIRIDEQLKFARRRMRRKNISLQPDIYFSPAPDGKGAKGKTKEYRSAVHEYISHYRKTLVIASKKKKVPPS